MSKLGFYGWIRENVRRAVLLGFSDAVEQLGSTTDAEEINPQLLAVLRQARAIPVSPEPAAAKTTGAVPGGRRRLGQTLDQIQEKAAKSASGDGPST
jgi:hypothetical protein